MSPPHYLQEVRAPDVKIVKDEIDALKKKMNTAVAEERYAEADEIKQQLKEKESELNGLTDRRVPLHHTDAEEVGQLFPRNCGAQIWNCIGVPSHR